MTKPSIKMPFQDWTPDTAAVYNEGMTTIQNCLPYLQAPNYSQSPSLSLSAIGNINGASYTVNAVKYNGTNAYLLRGSGLTGAADGKNGTLVFWIRFDSIGASRTIFAIEDSADGAVGLQVSILSSGKLQIGSPASFTATSNTVFSASATWHCIMCSWNAATNTFNLYIDGSSDGVSPTLTNTNIIYTKNNCSIGSSTGAPSFFNGCLAEMWFDQTAQMDFTSSGNRLKFMDSNGFPVNLGSTGQTPTGSSPIIYMKSAASTAGTNSGTGGNFTANGSFSIASSSPSDSTPTQYLGAGSFIDSTNSPHTYAGTTNKIAEITATTANNVSKSGGYTCTGFWKFAQLNNTVYATDYADAIQSMTVGGTAFADLAGTPPKAKAIAQVGQFIMVGNTNGGTYGGGTAGAVPNRVWWCAIGNPASWPDPLTSAGVAAQAGVQDLNAIYGEVRHITNGQLFGLVFQEHAITNFYYQGGDTVFNVNTYEKQRGLYCPNGACQVGNLVYFIDTSGFFVTDGASVSPIGHDLMDNTWLADVNTAYLDHVRASYDAQNKCIWWSYVSTQATLQGSFVSCDKVIVYNFADKRWGLGYTGQTIDMIFDANTLGYTMEQLDSVNSNLDLITPSLDSPYWNGGLPIVGAFGISQIGTSGSYASYYGTFTGAALTATLTTKTVNINQGGHAFITAAKPIIVGATLGNVSVYMGTQQLLSDSITYSSAQTPETRTGKCSFRSDGVFHTAKVTISGGFTNALGVEPEAQASGWA